MSAATTNQPNAKHAPSESNDWRAVWLTLLEVLLLAGSAMALAAYARFQWVEPAHMGPLCAAAATANDWRCGARDITIALFSGNRLGWAALAYAVLAFVVLWRAGRARALATVFSWLGIVVAAFGLVLYSAAWCAPALWLSALARLRTRGASEGNDRQ
jgi:hypothetical protein